MKALALILLIMFGVNAPAVEVPHPGKTDSRITFVDYDPLQVVHINGFYGYQTMVVLSPSEEIKTVTAGLATAWTIDVLGNKFTVKAKGAEQGMNPNINTNLTVVTDRHTYYLELVLAAPGVVPPNAKGMMFGIQYRYPKEDRTAAALAKAIENKDTGAKNNAYSALGSKELEPMAVWDDDTFTYMQFAKQQSIPAVVIIEADKSESTAPVHMDPGGVLVIEKIAKQFKLTIGQTATCVFNDGPRARTVSSDTGTTINGVRRVVR